MTKGLSKRVRVIDKEDPKLSQQSAQDCLGWAYMAVSEARYCRKEAMNNALGVWDGPDSALPETCSFEVGV